MLTTDCLSQSQDPKEFKVPLSSSSISVYRSQLKQKQPETVNENENCEKKGSEMITS